MKYKLRKLAIISFLLLFTQSIFAIEIKLRYSDGSSFYLEVEPYATIAYVKSEVQNYDGTDPASIRLGIISSVKGSHDMQDHFTLSDYGVVDQTDVFIVPRW